jgi:hypothetical protein
MRCLVLVLVLLACGACGETSQDPKAVAERQCRGVYDRLMRYVTGHGRYPETDEEWNGIRTGKDPWGHPLEIVMEEGEARVWSNGPDGEERTADDICYPPTD